MIWIASSNSGKSCASLSRRSIWSSVCLTPTRCDCNRFFVCPRIGKIISTWPKSGSISRTSVHLAHSDWESCFTANCGSCGMFSQSQSTCSELILGCKYFSDVISCVLVCRYVEIISMNCTTWISRFMKEQCWICSSHCVSLWLKSAQSQTHALLASLNPYIFLFNRPTASPCSAVLPSLVILMHNSVYLRHEMRSRSVEDAMLDQVRHFPIHVSPAIKALLRLFPTVASLWITHVQVVRLWSWPFAPCQHVWNASW